MAIKNPAPAQTAQQQPIVTPVQGGADPVQSGPGEDAPPAVQGDLAPARQKAAEAEQKRLGGEYIVAVYKFREALDAIGRAGVSESDAAALLNWSKAHLAAALGALGLVGRAIPLFDQVTRDKPDYAWAWAQYGEALRIELRDRLSADSDTKKAFDEMAVRALRAFDEAIRLKQGYAWALAHRGALLLLVFWYYTTHDLSLTEMPEEVLQLGAKDSEPVSLRLGRRIQSDLEAALQIEPMYAWAKLFMALFENLFDQHEASTGTLMNILTFGTGNNLPILTSLAMSHVYGGDLGQASLLAGKIMKFDPESPTAFYVQAKVLQNSAGEIERDVFESFRTRLEVAKDRIEVMLEDLQDGPPPRAELCKRRGASLDNVAIRTRLLGARLLAAKEDRLKSNADRAWTEQCKAFGKWKRS